MNDKPMLMQGEMARATLEGRKTQTRRVVKHSRQCPIEFIGPEGDQDNPQCWGFEDPNTATLWTLEPDGASQKLPCPHGQPGDLLWVRETFRIYDSVDECACYDHCECSRYHGKPMYFADGFSAGDELKWKPSIHMPRWASRLTLLITDVRVERVQDISEDDAVAEGALKMCMDGDGHFYLHESAGTFRTGFAGLWHHINAKRGYGWDANPWVWVIEYRAIEANVDDVKANPERYGIGEAA